VAACAALASATKVHDAPPSSLVATRVWMSVRAATLE
jgi:hypothetical protein